MPKSKYIKKTKEEDARIAPPMPTAMELTELRERLNSIKLLLEATKNAPNPEHRGLTYAEALTLVNDHEWVLNRLVWCDRERSLATIRERETRKKIGEILT